MTLRMKIKKEIDEMDWKKQIEDVYKRQTLSDGFVPGKFVR